ncbi:hypothetical protein DUI87_02484 [Hirundo rustica rustica]|uniref:CCHC-type domain-containing protein n=1 Tax=Hirundo rustica rustica TaxID=333673 RepID=A0A3M0LRH4_HIRRU|nr:hypothetical protein DUI87_02484 [Hirundo rustica rustica]
MSITDEDIIRITASEGIPVRKANALEFSRQASSILLSGDFMKQYFRQFTEAASEFQHDPMSSFSQIFLPRRDAAEKFNDAQQSLVPVLLEKEKEKEKEKETKPDEVQPQKQVDPGKDEAFANFQQRQCYKCGKQGHFKKDCPELAEIASSLDVCPRNPETGQIEGPFKLITWGKGYACVSTAVGLKWLAARHVKPYRIQTQAEADPKTGGREVGTQT